MFEDSLLVGAILLWVVGSILILAGTWVKLKI